VPLRDDLGLLETRPGRGPLLVDDLGLVGLPEVAELEVTKSPSQVALPTTEPELTSQSFLERTGKAVKGFFTRPAPSTTFSGRPPRKQPLPSSEAGQSALQRLAIGPIGDVVMGLLQNLRALGGSPEVPGQAVAAFPQTREEIREILKPEIERITIPMLGTAGGTSLAEDIADKVGLVAASGEVAFSALPVFIPRAISEAFASAMAASREFLGEKTFELTESPAAAAAAGTLPDAVLLFGPAVFMKIKGRAPRTQAELAKAVREEPRFVEEIAKAQRESGKRPSLVDDINLEEPTFVDALRRERAAQIEPVPVEPTEARPAGQIEPPPRGADDY